MLRGNSFSPLTREPLERHLFCNRNLRKRIEDYEAEVLAAIEMGVQITLADGASHEEGGAGSSSAPSGGGKRASSAVQGAAVEAAQPAKRSRRQAASR